MTAFVYTQTMAPHDFELFNQHESFSDFPTSTQAFMGMPTAISYEEMPFGAALSSIDSFQPLHAFTTQPRSQEPFQYSHQTAPQALKGLHHPYSPSGSPAHSINYDMPPPNLSTGSESGASVQSTSSSAIGSPSLHPQYHEQQQWTHAYGLGLAPGIVQQEHQYGQEPFSTSFEQEPIIANDKPPGFVDPNLINSFSSPIPFSGGVYPEITTTSPHNAYMTNPPSPAPSNSSQGPLDSRRFRPSGSQSPYLTNTWQPYPQYPGKRRPSAESTHSKTSHHSNRSGSGSLEYEEDGREKGLCPYPECGRVFKDLKAHKLTHQLERPEKCPIASCEYHLKGFARKYDKNRHTLTHYKGTMVCGFCPGSGSASEKSFNRADVFKRHLTSVHGVEQTAPNSRKRSPSGSGRKSNSTAAQNTSAGTCSTCSVTFANAQEFYEHLDDCVLRVVQQTDPAEAINQKHLQSMAEDTSVQETLDKHHLDSSIDVTVAEYHDQEDDEDEEEFVDNDDAKDGTYGSNPRAGKGAMKSKKPS